MRSNASRWTTPRSRSRRSATATVDATRPVSDSSQNGATSRIRSLRPLRPHTHVRFAKYDSGMPQQTAITLADPAGTPAPSANATRTAALSRVVPTETKKQRDMRCTIDVGIVHRRDADHDDPITKKRTTAAISQVTTRTATCAARLVVTVSTTASAAVVTKIDPP